MLKWKFSAKKCMEVLFFSIPRSPVGNCPSGLGNHQHPSRALYFPTSLTLPTPHHPPAMPTFSPMWPPPTSCQLPPAGNVLPQPRLLMAPSQYLLKPWALDLVAESPMLTPTHTELGHVCFIFSSLVLAAPELGTARKAREEGGSLTALLPWGTSLMLGWGTAPHLASSHPCVSLLTQLTHWALYLSLPQTGSSLGTRTKSPESRHTKVLLHALLVGWVGGCVGRWEDAWVSR